jgi:hypothetical protein
MKPSGRMDRATYRPPFPAPSRILGLDFSGARDAGRRIWLAEGVAVPGALRVASLRRGAALPGGGPAREACLAALAAYLRTLGFFAAGLDFPFSLHCALVPEPDLPSFVAAMAARYPDAEAFRAACRAAGRAQGEAQGGGAGDERALRRRCDEEARTPFAPHNLRVYRQTFHGVRDLLAPLLAAGARVLPVQAPAGEAPWLLEACPASALKRVGRYRSYKGRTAAHRAWRRTILRWLVGEGLAPDEPRLAALAVDDPGGDALDALLCAWIAWRAVTGRAPLLPPLAPEHRVEGYVYAG